jgi:hypothetical protein
MSILIWLLFLCASVLGFREILKGWTEGEFTHSRNGSFEFKKIRRDDNPSAFQLYLIGMLLLNITFLFVLIIWGFFAFR